MTRHPEALLLAYLATIPVCPRSEPGRSCLRGEWDEAPNLIAFTQTWTPQEGGDV